VPALLVALAIPSYYAVRAYRYEQLLAEAHQELDRGAIIQARFLLRVLVANFGESDRTLAALSKFASLSHRPEAIQYLQQAIELNPDSADYRLALVLAQVQFNRTPAAESTLENWPTHQRGTAAYHRAVATLAFARADWPAAVRELETVLAMEGTTPVNRLNLAKMRLHLPEPAARQAALRELEQLREIEETRWEAGRALVQDALRQKDTDAALQHLEMLRQQATTQANQDAFLLDAYTSLNQPGPAREHLLVARQKWQSHPEAAALLIGWMSTHGQADDAITWSETLKPTLRENYPVAFAVGEARLKLKEARELTDHLERLTWPEDEPLRFLLLARAGSLLATDTPRTENIYLRRAVEQAGRTPNGLSRLDRVLQRWGWDEARVPVWWAMLEQRTQVPKALVNLYQWYDRRGDSAGLHRVAAYELELNPQNVMARNNYAYLSLLLERDGDRAWQIIRQLREEHPQQNSIASTYALGCLRRGRAAEALGVLRQLDENTRQRPAIRALEYLALVQTGDNEQAVQLRGQIQTERLLPREQLLLKNGGADE